MDIISPFCCFFTYIIIYNIIIYYIIHGAIVCFYGINFVYKELFERVMHVTVRFCAYFDAGRSFPSPQPNTIKPSCATNFGLIWLRINKGYKEEIKLCSGNH